MVTSSTLRHVAAAIISCSIVGCAHEPYAGRMPDPAAQEPEKEIARFTIDPSGDRMGGEPYEAESLRAVIVRVSPDSYRELRSANGLVEWGGALLAFGIVDVLNGFWYADGLSKGIGTAVAAGGAVTMGLGFYQQGTAIEAYNRELRTRIGPSPAERALEK